jgi:hypothetical protein
MEKSGLHTVTFRGKLFRGKLNLVYISNMCTSGASKCALRVERVKR